MVVYLAAALVAFASAPVAIGLDLALALAYLIPSEDLRASAAGAEEDGGVGEQG